MSAKSKPEIYFEKLDGFGPLAIYWFDGPYGDAVESLSGAGVGFFNQHQELLAVQFDNVAAVNDHQTLTFKGGWSVSVHVKNGKVTKCERHHKDSKKKGRAA
jgi:hypothetical protein